MTDRPTHVALIMDGNRRWATKRGLPKIMGHTEGAKRLKPLIKKAIELDISYITLWALSTENLKERSEKELAHLFGLFKRIVEYLADFTENNVKFQAIGDLSALPQDVQDALAQVAEASKENSGLTLTLAVNYGGRDEMVRAVKKMITEGKNPEEITEEVISAYLDTGDMPDPDMIIRTGGAPRLSGYLPWQGTYAELYFTDLFWPEFTPEAFEEAVTWFGTIQRNKGA